MPDLQLLVDLVLAVLAAFVGGTLAHRFGQPVILGYLLAGVAIGPFTPGPTANTHSVQVLAELGVALPSFPGGGQGLVTGLAPGAAGSAGVLLGAYFVCTRLVPIALGRVAITRTRELFLPGVVALALGTALVSQLARVSRAFAAF